MATRGRPRGSKTKPQVDQPQARYDAAGNGRRMRGWTAPSTGPNKAITGLQNIRNRARDVSRNDWSGESSTQKWTTNLVGIGITPRFKRLTSKDRKRELMDLWNDFVKESDADCVLNLYGQQTLAVRAWLESGEVFARRRSRRPDSGLAVPMQVQLIEAEFVPMLDADTWPGLPTGNKIRSGIELNRIGSRVAYWVYKEHPGDGQSTTVNPEDLVRVPASEMRHVFMPTRPGQLRGVSALAPVLARLRNIGDYDDAVLERQKLANLFVGFIKYTLPKLYDDVDPLTNLPLQFGASNDEPLAGLSPGIMQELDPGQDVQFSNPPEAGTTYSDYMRTQHLGTAAASGLPYELFSGDIREISDRTLRVIINEFRRLAEQRQWQVIIPMFCQPVVEWWADAAALAGKLSVAEIDLVKRCEHAPHGWEYIHPVQDAQGKQLEVEAGFRSRSSVIAERGDDPEDVDEERKMDKERETEMGLAIEPVDPNAPADPNNPDEQDDPQQPDQPTLLMMQALGRLEGKMDAPRAEAPRQERAEPVQLTINNHIPQTVVENHVEPTPVTVENKVENKVDVAPAAVSVTNEVKTPVVNVAAPNVDIVNEVQPAEVNVNLPDRQTTSKIQRDSLGNIINVVQTETTLQ